MWLKINKKKETNKKNYKETVSVTATDKDYEQK